MKFQFFVLFSAFSFLAYAESKVTISVTLTPAGSFQAVSNRPKGNLTKSGDEFKADKVTVSIESFKTGIDLRDEHFWKHLQANKYAKATLTDLKAKAGQGTAMLEVNGVIKAIKISYTEKNGEILANLKVNAKDFNLPSAEYLGVGVKNEVIVDVILPYQNK